MVTFGDLIMANNRQFLAANPERKAELIKHVKNNKPSECRECLFFKWILSEGCAIKAYCAADGTYKPRVTPRPKSCPLDADDHAGQSDEQTD